MIPPALMNLYPIILPHSMIPLKAYALACLKNILIEGLNNDIAKVIEAAIKEYEKLGAQHARN